MVLSCLMTTNVTYAWWSTWLFSSTIGSSIHIVYVVWSCQFILTRFLILMNSLLIKFIMAPDTSRTSVCTFVFCIPKVSPEWIFLVMSCIIYTRIQCSLTESCSALKLGIYSWNIDHRRSTLYSLRRIQVRMSISLWLTRRSWPHLCFINVHSCLYFRRLGIDTSTGAHSVEIDGFQQG